MPILKTSPQIYVLYLEFGDKNRSDLEHFLLPLLRRVFPDLHYQGIIIDNSEKMTPSLIKGFHVLEGNNSSREFSGWNRGLESIRGRLQPDDVICFCNDTFAKNYGHHYLDWFDQKEISQALLAGKIVGYVDERPDPVTLFGRSLFFWIRTSLFFVRSSELQCLPPFGIPTTEDQLFAHDGDDLFLPDSPLSANLRESLNHWLTGRPLSPKSYDGGLWHSAQPLTNETRDALQGKAKSILGELYLSAEWQGRGFGTFDVRQSKRRCFGLFHLARRLGLLATLRKLRRRISP